MLNGVKGVYYREVQVLKTRVFRSLFASMVSPGLFLIAFGYGLGRFQNVAGMPYLEFLFAGLLCMSTLNSCYSIATDINIARFYFKTFDEYLIAPVPRWHIIMGEVLYGITKGCINLFIFGAYALVAGINIHFSFIAALILLIHMAVFSLLGFAVAVKVKHHSDQTSISTFIITPMTFLSGVFFPVNQAPLFLQGLVQFFPVTHSVALLRPALTGGEFTRGAYHFTMLIAFLALFAVLSALFIRRSEG